MKYKAKELFSIPNLLSYVRLLLIPAFLVTYLNAHRVEDYLAAAGIVLLSGLTDFADGFIARRFHMVTEWGKILDPIADKLTQGALILALMFKIPSMWLLFILFAVKELTMGGCSLFLLKKGKKLDGALWFGKVSTFVFYIVMFLLIAIPIPLYNVYVLYGMLILTAFFLMLAFILYLRVFYQMWHETKLSQQDQPLQSSKNQAV